MGGGGLDGIFNYDLLLLVALRGKTMLGFPLPVLCRRKKTMRETDCCGKTLVLGKAKPIALRVATSLGEPILGG